MLSKKEVGEIEKRLRKDLEDAESLLSVCRKQTLNHTAHCLEGAIDLLRAAGNRLRKEYEEKLKAETDRARKGHRGS